MNVAIPDAVAAPVTNVPIPDENEKSLNDAEPDAMAGDAVRLPDAA